MLTASALHQLIDVKIAEAGDRDLDTVVARLRRDGLGWRRISSHLSNRYGVTITHMTLTRWYPHA